MALYRLLKQCKHHTANESGNHPIWRRCFCDLISAPSRTKGLNSNFKSRPPLTIFSLDARPGATRYFSVSSAYPWTVWAALPPPGVTHKTQLSKYHAPFIRPWRTVYLLSRHARCYRACYFDGLPPRLSRLKKT